VNFAFTMKITKDTIIGECIEKYPDTLGFLLEEGFHCVGCFAAHFETIEMGFKMHGKSDEEIKRIVKKLNNIIDKNGKD